MRLGLRVTRNLIRPRLALWISRCVGVHAPVVTGSMHKRLSRRGIEAPRGACDGGGRGSAAGREVRYPYPGCFAKRGWIYLIAKELTFLGAQKRLQSLEKSRVRAKAAGGGSEGGWGEHRKTDPRAGRLVRVKRNVSR